MIEYCCHPKFVALKFVLCPSVTAALRSVRGNNALFVSERDLKDLGGGAKAETYAQPWRTLLGS